MTITVNIVIVMQYFEAEWNHSLYINQEKCINPKEAFILKLHYFVFKKVRKKYHKLQDRGLILRSLLIHCLCLCHQQISFVFTNDCLRYFLLSVVEYFLKMRPLKRLEFETPSLGSKWLPNSNRMKLSL